MQVQDVILPSQLLSDGDEAAISILPRNFDSVSSPADYVFERETSTVIAIGKSVGLKIEVSGGRPFTTIHENDAQLIAPILHFAHEVLADASAVTVVHFLAALAKHIKSRWGAKKTAKDEAVLVVLVTKGKKTKQVTYCGPVDGHRANRSCGAGCVRGLTWAR